MDEPLVGRDRWGPALPAPPGLVDRGSPSHWDEPTDLAVRGLGELEKPRRCMDEESLGRDVPDEEGFRRHDSCCGGVAEEVRRRYRFCGADYYTAFRRWPKALSATLFMFFATFFSTVALGALVARQTNHRIGLSEYLLMNSLAGMAHALLGTQPLLVLRPTGPITAILQKLSGLSDSFGLDFYCYLAATGVCVCGLMALVASTEFSRHIRRLTPFTHDIFACFVGAAEFEPVTCRLRCVGTQVPSGPTDRMLEPAVCRSARFTSTTAPPTSSRASAAQMPRPRLARL